MKERLLIRSTAFEPDALKVLFKAFDDAWDHLAPKFGTDQLAIENARLELANVILGVANEESTDPEELKAAALRVMSLDEPSTSSRKFGQFIRQ